MLYCGRRTGMSRRKRIDTRLKHWSDVSEDVVCQPFEIYYCFLGRNYARLQTPIFFIKSLTPKLFRFRYQSKIYKMNKQWLSGAPVFNLKFRRAN